MKNFYLLVLIITSSFIYGQQYDVIKKEDFKLEEGHRWRITAKPFNLKNGNNKSSEVSLTVSCSESIYSKIDIHKVNEIISFANDKAKELVKNKYTYESKIIKLSSLPDTNEWHMTIEYTAQNDYGATKDGLIVASFNEKYEFIKMSAL